MHHKIHDRNGYFQLDLLLENSAARVALSKVHYTLGHFEITSLDNPTFSKRLAMLYKNQNSLKPMLKGEGQVIFKTTPYCIECIELHNQTLFIQPSLSLASSSTLELSEHTIHSPLKRIAGEPKHQTIISGSGLLFLLSPGPLICLELEKQTLKTTATIVARSTSTHFSQTPWSQNHTLQLPEVKKNVQLLRGPGQVYLPQYIAKEVVLYRSFLK